MRVNVTENENERERDGKGSRNGVKGRGHKFVCNKS